MFLSQKEKTKIGFSLQNDTSTLGSYGEELVINWLEKNNFKIEARNYRKKFAEIDIIATKKDLVVFVEVKSRKDPYPGIGLSEVVNYSKQKKIIMAAKDYISRSKFVDKVYRFDIALVERVNSKFEVKYIENAFTESY